MDRVPDIVRAIPLLSQLAETQQDQVLAVGGERVVERGEILFHEGLAADAMYAVVAGQVKLVRYSPRGKEMLLHLVQPGQSFAEAALFGEGNYPATAEAVVRSVLWSFPRQRLVELIRTSPQLGIAMIASVSTWTRRLAGKLELLTQRRVEERLAIYLLARATNPRLNAGDVIPLAEPRHLIAAQCGTAPEVLSRTFRRLEEEGLVDADPDRVRVLDPERLRQLAEWIGE